MMFVAQIMLLQLTAFYPPEILLFKVRIGVIMAISLDVVILPQVQNMNKLFPARCILILVYFLITFSFLSSLTLVTGLLTDSQDGAISLIIKDAG